MMYVHRSNSLEELVSQLAELVSTPLEGVLEQESVLIQSAGMERYLSRELSRRIGIVANVKFPFPRAFLRDLLDNCLGVDERAQSFERQNLAWSLFAALGRHAAGSHPAFESVREYLSDDVDSTKRFLLAERLANLFDQYVTYRPRMVISWERGADPDDLQAILWRELVEVLGSAHFAARCQAFMNEVSDEEVRAHLPARIALMGGPGLPPLFLQMLARVGRALPCHVFSFTVCQEYFADAHPLEDELPEPSWGLHPLLLSLAKVGADYQHLLEMIGEYQEGASRFAPAPTHTVLGRLQADLISGKAGESAEGASSFDHQSDESITLDSCHSPLREVETLHDRLLSYFAADPTLRPEDVVVLAPNIEEYSPLISAVFSARASAASGAGEVTIPFRVADRSEKNTNSAARALLSCLGLLQGRFKLSSVLDLLQLEPVRERYGVDAEDLERISRWLTEAGIRWGIDGKHLAEYGLPEDNPCTWRFGLSRLLLGYSLADDGEQLWQGVVPFDDVPARDGELLGQLCDFVDALAGLKRRLDQAGPRGLPLSDWESFFDDLVLTLIPKESDGSWDAGTVREALFEMLRRPQVLLATEHSPAEAERGSFASSKRESSVAHFLGLPGMMHLLEQELDASRPSTDFLAGGVTFCALLPLRTIPFRVVCVLGLNQGEFPRADSHHHLDLIARSPKRGDRSLRADDRYLFLEVLLAAREKLSLSFVGRSVQDNAIKPPSVVVTELSSVIDRSLGLTDASYLTARLHPLQPFHPSYFSNEGPSGRRSFDSNAYQGALALTQPATETRPFFERDAYRFAEELDSVEMNLSSLIQFWKDPSSAFLQAHGVIIDDEIEETEEREPVAESSLSKYLVGERVLEHLVTGTALRPEIELARGELPVGQGGKTLLARVSQTAQDIWEQSRSYREQAPKPAVALSLELGKMTDLELCDLLGASPESPWVQALGNCSPMELCGHADKVYGGVRVETSYGQRNFARVFSLWVHHLAICATGGSVGEVQFEGSVLISRAGAKETSSVDVMELVPVAQAEAERHLRNLAVLAKIGARVPLPFFGEISQKYLDGLLKTKRGVTDENRVELAIQEARKAIANSQNVRFTSALEFLYRGSDPLGLQEICADDYSESAFARLSEAVLSPIARATRQEAVS